MLLKLFICTKCCVFYQQFTAEKEKGGKTVKIKRYNKMSTLQNLIFKTDHANTHARQAHLSQIFSAFSQKTNVQNFFDIIKLVLL